MSAIFIVIYVLIFVIFVLVVFSIMQIKLAGIRVKDFWEFIEANQMLDKLEKLAKQYENMSPQEQVIYLAEAEKIFTAFDKVPEALWDEEYEKYKKGINVMPITYLYNAWIVLNISANYILGLSDEMNIRSIIKKL